jgi:hypothetical protein
LESKTYFGLNLTGMRIWQGIKLDSASLGLPAAGMAKRARSKGSVAVP